MDELWKDMSLASTPVALQSYHLHTPYRGAVYLQDYPAGAVPQPPPAHTALTLGFTYLGGTGINSATSSGDDPAGHFGFSVSGGSRRVTVGAPAAPAAGGGGRRQRRMIKNRESAARSRARKQAYTNELELELAQLRRENQMLIQREQDLINDRLAMAAQAAVPDCRSGRRSSQTRSIHQLQIQQQQTRCRSAPPP